MSESKMTYADLMKAKRLDFYKYFNYDYFSRKVIYLIALISKKDQLVDLFSAMPKYGALQVDIEASKVKADDYIHDLELEIHMTLFLALETLFRVWFAAMLSPGSEHVFLKQFSSERFADYFHRFFIKEDYKSILPRFTSIEDLAEEMFFLGIDLERSLGKDVAAKRIENVLSFVFRLAKRFEDRDIYNAYKHCSLDFKIGTYQPGDISMNNFSLIDKRCNGLSTIKYPTEKERQSGSFSVEKITNLMAPDCSAAETLAAAYLLQNIIESRKFTLNLITTEDLSKYIFPFSRGAEILDEAGVQTQVFKIKDIFESSLANNDVPKKSFLTADLDSISAAH